MIGKNKGKTHEKRERIRPEDNNLPKYLRHYKDKSGKEGYRINNHPILPDKSFLSKYKTMEEKYQTAIEFLNTSVRLNE